MWLMVLFDLPFNTKEQHRVYALFRKNLFHIGFCAMQKSVYIRWEASETSADTTENMVHECAPDDGHISLLRLSDRAMKSGLFLTNGQTVPGPEPMPDVLVC